MKSSSSPWIAAIALAILFGCMQEEDQPLAPGSTGGKPTGSAEIRLPALPAGLLAKRAVLDTVPDSLDVMFILTISGPGMVARKQAWPLSRAGGEAVRVDNIPVGPRLFRGALEVNGIITHEDSTRAAIEGGRTARVNLKLRSAIGNAVVCVEIEGAPLPAGCRPPPPVDSSLEGCYSILVHGGIGGFPGKLRIEYMNPSHPADTPVQGPLFQGVITWENGVTDTSIGRLSGDGTVTFGLGHPNAWELKGRFSRGEGTFQGSYFYHSVRHFGGAFVAHPAACDPIGPDPVVPDSILSCWEVAQTLDGKSQEGTLYLIRQGKALSGQFQWSCCSPMRVIGMTTPVLPNDGLYLYGALPPELSAQPDGRPDSVHIKGQVPVGGGHIAYGAIYGSDPVNGFLVQRGAWKGSPISCGSRRP